MLGQASSRKKLPESRSSRQRPAFRNGNLPGHAFRIAKVVDQLTGESFQRIHSKERSIVELKDCLTWMQVNSWLFQRGPFDGD